MKGFITFGEIMLRLTPSYKNERILSSNQFSVGYAGAESNIAVSLACLGNEVEFVTKLPNNPLGEAALASLRQYGVTTKNSLRGGNRIGTYFIEIGSSIRPSRVVYDRAGSALSAIASGEFDWTKILSNKKWLHLSGITPALSKQCAEETILAAKTAQDMGVKVSFDLNFRRSLWPNRKSARAIFDNIISSTDILFANTGALKDVYDYSFPGKNKEDQTMLAMEKASTVFGIAEMAFTIREHQSASQNKLCGIGYRNGNIIRSNTYQVEVVDRFGTGDAFAAGYLHALGREWPLKKSIDFATAAFAYKHTLIGDVNTSSEQEIEVIMEGDLSGHVIR
ncbi:sugar kinase [Muricauda sp. 2012CJ35-5]|uniref:Sugar kinase n=1 Tax=Flagellimonas spongiicola TaxID=2942208 RepID=A0ABT0PQR8_9FLAO|nr:sugar kinase [Allomuricauda spongiicola]MCL6273737.1 sugar kinase [Allomuricauda spongiicola]